MSATNKTTHYELPVFLGSDKPAWLVDWNGAMADIDSAIYEAKTTADGAASSVTTVAADLNTLSGTVTTQGTSITTLSGSLTTLIGTVNTITSLIGNGEPTTTDKTIIGAINEINAKIPAGGLTAASVSYDNTSSTMTADDVQEAIDELHTSIESLTPVSSGKRVIVIGDSYGSQTSSENFVDMLSTKFGASNEVINVSEPGMGFARQGSSSHTALTLLQSEGASIQDHDTITDVIITVGVNDTVDSTTYTAALTAITQLLTYIRTEYVNAKIRYAFIGNFMSAGDAGHPIARKQLLLTAIPAFYDVFEENDCEVMRGAEFVMHDFRNVQPANITHPSATGAEAIAQFIYTWYVRGFAKYQTHYETEIASAGNAHVLVDINGEYTEVQVLSWGTAATGSVSGITDIITLPSDFPVRGDANYNYPQYQLILGRTAGGDVPILAFVEEGKIQFAATATLTGATKLMIHMNTMYA